MSNSVPRDENIGEVPVYSGDGFLICSDGFWEYVYDTEILLDYAASRTAHEWIVRMLGRIVQRTGDGSDNLSAAAVMLK